MLNIMSVYFTIYLIALFFILTPGVLVSLPPKSSKLTVAVTHALVFAVVYQLTNKMVSQALEGFQVKNLPNGEKCDKWNKAPDGGDSDCKSGFCRHSGGTGGVRKSCSGPLPKNSGDTCRKDSHCMPGSKCVKAFADSIAGFCK
jgi:hypothetical protein